MVEQTVRAWWTEEKASDILRSGRWPVARFETFVHYADDVQDMRCRHCGEPFKPKPLDTPWTVRKRRAAQLRAEERTREYKRPRRVEQRAARAARDAEYKASLRPETPEERERIAAKRAEWQRLRALRPDEDLFRTYLRMHGTRFPALLPKTLGPAFPWLPASEDASRWE